MSGPALAGLLAYALQLGVLVLALLAASPVVSRCSLRMQLAIWQTGFAAALLLAGLPWLGVRPVPAALGGMLRLDVFGAVAAPAGRGWAWREVVLGVVLAGVGWRLVRLAAGARAVRALVRRARPLEPLSVHLADPTLPSAVVRISDDLASPATVGVFRPVILLPPRFLTLPHALQRGVLWHEWLHIARLDWPVRLAEEVWCAINWWNPAARMLAGRLDLARELVVDERTIAATGDRRAYVEALLAFGGEPGSHAAFTPFIRPRSLPIRIARLTREVPVTRRSTALAFGFIVFYVPAVAASAISLIPTERPGVTGSPDSGRTAQVSRAGDGVEMPQVVRKVRPEYTRAAMDAKVQGAVLLAVVVEADGTVGQVDVLRSLDQEYGLDEAAVAAVRQWVFEPGLRDGSPVPVEVQIELMFTLRS